MIKENFSSPEVKSQPNQFELIKKELAANPLDYSWAKKIIEEKSEEFIVAYVCHFLKEKEVFEQDLILYCLGVLDYIEESNLPNYPENIVLCFPGRSGMGLEISVETALREHFGKRPKSLRLPTDKNLKKGLMIDDTWISGQDRDDPEKAVKLKSATSFIAPAKNWDRTKIATPRLDEIILKSENGQTSTHPQEVIILDTVRANERTLNQVVFALKKYPIDKISFLTGNGNLSNGIFSGDYLGEIDQTVAMPGYELKDEVDRWQIYLQKPEDLDTYCNRIMWLATGFTKKPVKNTVLSDSEVKNPPIELVPHHYLETETLEQLQNYLMSLGKIAAKIKHFSLASVRGINI